MKRFATSSDLASHPVQRKRQLLDEDAGRRTAKYWHTNPSPGKEALPQLECAHCSRLPSHRLISSAVLKAKEQGLAIIIHDMQKRYTAFSAPLAKTVTCKTPAEQGLSSFVTLSMPPNAFDSVG
jgi:hypothetical protein